MVLAGAGRAPGAELGHVDLVDLVEALGRAKRASTHDKPGQKPAPTTTDTPAARASSDEVEQQLHVLDGVGQARPPTCPGAPALRGQLQLRPRRRGQDHDIDRAAARSGPPSATRACCPSDAATTAARSARRCPRRTTSSTVDSRQQLPGHPGADGATADDRGLHGSMSALVSSRQPPDCGGTPPVPRTRRTAATSPARPNGDERAAHIVTDRSRHRTSMGLGSETVGLAGIEPATSPLSGVRSNRLSYSPAAARHGTARGNRPVATRFPLQGPR